MQLFIIRCITVQNFFNLRLLFLHGLGLPTLFRCEEATLEMQMFRLSKCLSVLNVEFQVLNVNL